MPSRKKGGGQVYVATETGFAEVGGREFEFHRGQTRVDGDSDLFKWKSFHENFEPADEHLHYQTEQATAAPGERRDVFLGHETGQNEAETAAAEELTVVELRQRLHELGGTPGSRNKAELVEAIAEAEEESDG